MKTPLYSLTEEQKDFVYDPAEDTFLLMDALEILRDEFLQSPPTVILEIGCGSGVISVFVQQLIAPTTPCLSLCTDINPIAVEVTLTTAALNQARLDPIEMDLGTAFRSGLFDVIVFNPPYVPTYNEECKQSKLLANSWAGGENGRIVLERLLPKISQLLSSKGIFILVAIKENNIEDLLHFSPELQGEIVIERRAGREHLFVLKFRKI